MIRFLTNLGKSLMLLGLLAEQPLLFVAILLAIIIALTVHEYSHALVANLLGDRTAEQAGRLSLNPMVHLDVVGFLMLLMVGFGYAKPVPYNPAYLKHQRRDPVLIGIAGPASNVLMAIIFALALKFFAVSLGPTNLLLSFLYFAAFININLAIFNLIPVPPLDGSKVLLALLHGHQYAHIRHILVRQGPFLLLLLIIVDSFSGLGIFARLFTFFGSAFFSLLGIPL